MKPSPCSPSCASASGFSLVELLVALLVSGVIAGAALSITLSARRILSKDEKRIQVNQNLRIGLDLVGVDVRQAGERLPQDFPAVEIQDGGGSSDVLIVRRNLLDEVLPVCGNITAGTTSTQVRIALGSIVAPQGCKPVPDDDGDGWADNLGAWRDYRDENGGAVKAYIYNPVNRQGEFFEYDGDGTTQHFIHKASTGPWQHGYGLLQLCRVYIVEERRYELAGDTLRMRLTADDETLNVLHGLTAFHVEAILEDGSVVASLGMADDWDDLAALSVSVTGEAQVNGRALTRTASSQFFPRNVLSL